MHNGKTKLCVPCIEARGVNIIEVIVLGTSIEVVKSSQCSLQCAYDADGNLDPDVK